MKTKGDDKKMSKMYLDNSNWLDEFFTIVHEKDIPEYIKEDYINERRNILNDNRCDDDQLFTWDEALDSLVKEFIERFESIEQVYGGFYKTKRSFYLCNKEGHCTFLYAVGDDNYEQL